MTSGSTGEPKLIPVTATSRANHRQLTRLWYYRASIDHPGLFSGKLLGVVSPAHEGNTAGNIPFGAASGLDLSEQSALDPKRFRPALRDRRSQRLRRQVLPHHAPGHRTAISHFSARPIRARFCVSSKPPIASKTKSSETFATAPSPTRWNLTCDDPPSAANPASRKIPTAPPSWNALVEPLRRAAPQGLLAASCNSSAAGKAAASACV